jgi:hypothetical protein
MNEEEQMTKCLSKATVSDYERLLEEMQEITNCAFVQESAQKFMDRVYEHFSASLVLVRLFLTVRYDQLPEEDRLFVDERGRQINSSHLIHDATPIFTQFGTRGSRPEWNNRRDSSFFRCIPLVSTSFVSSLSMLSKQFESVEFDLGLIDAWQAKVVSSGHADQYRGLLYIKDAGTAMDSKGRMIVPKQEFVTANNVKTTLGFGSGYAIHPTLATVFAFTNETIELPVVEQFSNLLEKFISSTESLVSRGQFFMGE